ncbi:MAG: hypothetical protein ABI451_02475 [Dokdonella sp.]
MSFDSAYAWWQVRNGLSTDVTSPTMILLWRACDSIIAGPGLLFTFHLALFWAGLALVFAALLGPIPVRIGIPLLVALTPVPLVLRAHVWTDAGMTVALVCAVGGLAQWHATHDRRWLALIWPSLFYALAMRLNALPATLPLFAWMAYLFCRDTPRAMLRWHPIARVAVASVAIVVVSSAGVFTINRTAPEHVPLWPSLLQWDVAAVSIATGSMLLPATTVGDGLTVAELAQAFRPWSNTPMLQNTTHGIRDALGPWSQDELDALRDAWIAAVTEYPLHYFRHRLRVTLALFGTHAPDWPKELTYVDRETSYQDNPPIAPNRSGLHRTVMGWAVGAIATPWFAAWPYLLVGLVAAPFAFRQRHQLSGPIACLLLASAWLHALPLIVLAPAAELRYLLWSCLASLLAAGVVIVNSGFSRRRMRIPAAAPPIPPAKLQATPTRALP